MENWRTSCLGVNLSREFAEKSPWGTIQRACWSPACEYVTQRRHNLAHQEQETPMTYTWLLVADRSRAKIYSQKSTTQQWELIESFDFPVGRLRAGEKSSDRPPLFSAQGENRFAAEPHQDHRHVTAAAFSKQLIQYLDLARQENRFQEFWFVAPPLFLGEFRHQLPNPLAALLTREWPKDLTNMSEPELWDELESLLEAEAAQ
jgi:protein required for attachment to host cells